LSALFFDESATGADPAAEIDDALSVRRHVHPSVSSIHNKIS